MDNKFLSFGAHALVKVRLISLMEKLEARRANLLRILIYHRIGNPEPQDYRLDPTLLSATPQMFEQQMRFVREHYHLLSVVDLLQAIETHEPLPPGSLLVTFDDGYHDFVDTAWPILERYQIPTLMFLATGYLSPPSELYWWDLLYQGICQTRRSRLSLPGGKDFPLEDHAQRWQAFLELKRLLITENGDRFKILLDGILDSLDFVPQTAGLMMNWSEARLLHKQGCHLAAHTRSHVILSSVPAEQAIQQIRDSQQDIYREIGTTLPVLAYPSGHSPDLNQALLPLLHQDGYQLAMSSIPGINAWPQSELLMLKRIGLSTRVDLSEFRLALTGIYHFYCMVQRQFFHRD
jgi:peptidoglycan/xylan/chitin deacetylase (PgdA/CDA1 family)